MNDLRHLADVQLQQQRPKVLPVLGAPCIGLFPGGAHESTEEKKQSCCNPD